MTHTTTTTSLTVKTYDLGTGLQLIEAADLNTLAAQINDAARAAERHARGATENALIVGAMPIEAKKLVTHGEWDNWFLQNCEIAPRTVQPICAWRGHSRNWTHQKRNALRICRYERQCGPLPPTRTHQGN